MQAFLMVAMTVQQIFIGLFVRLLTVIIYLHTPCVYTKTADLDIIQELSEMVLEIAQLEAKIFIIHLVMIQSAMQHLTTQQETALQIQ